MARATAAVAGATRPGNARRLGKEKEKERQRERREKGKEEETPREEERGREERTKEKGKGRDTKERVGSAGGSDTSRRSADKSDPWTKKPKKKRTKKKKRSESTRCGTLEPFRLMFCLCTKTLRRVRKYGDWSD